MMMGATPQPPPPNGLCSKCSLVLDEHGPWSPYVKDKDRQPDLRCPTGNKPKTERCMECGDQEWKHGGLCNKCYDKTGDKPRKK